MRQLSIIRREIAALDKADAIRLKGIIKDYLADSRDLKNDLLEAIDLGIVEQFIAKKKCSSQIKEQLRLSISDSTRLRRLMGVCMYVTGVKAVQPDNYYSVKMPKQVKSNQHNKQQSSILVNSQVLVQASRQMNSNWLYTSIALVILVVTVFVVAVNWKPSLNAKVKKANRIEGVLVNSTVENSSVQGYYLGTIQTNGIKKKYVLIVDGNQDSLQCELLDYPHFNEAKKYFSLRKGENKHYYSTVGSFFFKNDSLISLAQPTTDNQMHWNFAKKN